MMVYCEDFNSTRIYFSENQFDKSCMKKYLNILNMKENVWEASMKAMKSIYIMSWMIIESWIEFNDALCIYMFLLYFLC